MNKNLVFTIREEDDQYVDDDHDFLERISAKFEAIAAEARKKLREKRDPSADFDVEAGG